MEVKVWKILSLLLITCRSAASADLLGASSDSPDSDPDLGLHDINITTTAAPQRNFSVQPIPSPDPGDPDGLNRETMTRDRNFSVTPELKTDKDFIFESSPHPHLTEPPTSQTPPLLSGSNTSISNTTYINTTNTTSITSSSQPPPLQTHTPEPVTPSPTNATRFTPNNSSLESLAFPKDGPNETFTGDLKTSTVPTLSNSSTKTHLGTPPQLHVGGDMVIHESSSMDPLLTGLVTAFTITAVFFSLLLFHRLRRRQRGSEFSRLQDVSMDDVMEDTPLSMYNY
ncbi:proline-rich receptor-like protein kinase PERK8 isoform X1 [Xyrichtys novacula]|uniref:Proline-rich receptor-like protein kinase PERK8 isoform X1 n=1 Tax=Xyrichtys novacula TaxID=13765 RepID=A0AAV1FFT2_XYRNO|nr:proline-rich receptor-like protein kinase PERK8 isoform X1 [Xyrichtys novacula]